MDDHLGTTQVELDASGTVTWQGQFTPFGSELPDGSTTMHYKFTGKERDAETGLDYFGARYYGSAMGRWVSPDWALKPEAVPYSKLDDPQSLNLYGYVGNNPLNKADDDGHAWIDFAAVARGIGRGLQKFGKWLASPEPQPTVSTSQGDGTVMFSLIVGGMAQAADNANIDMGESEGNPELEEEGIELENGPLQTLSASETEKTYQTYTKTNPDTGQVYSGRTSGTGTPEENVAARDSGHPKTEKGFGPAVLDKSSSNPDAIRGREQQLIDANGGSQRSRGTSGNVINGVSPKNPKGSAYKDAADKEFGPQ